MKKNRTNCDHHVKLTCGRIWSRDQAILYCDVLITAHSKSMANHHVTSRNWWEVFCKGLHIPA